MTNFLFLRSLVSAAGKCLLTLRCKLLAPMVQRAVGDSQIACNLRLRFVAGSHQLDRFLLKFSRKGSLLLLHDPFPFCGESTLSSLFPPFLWVKTTRMAVRAADTVLLDVVLIVLFSFGKQLLELPPSSPREQTSEAAATLRAAVVRAEP